MQDSFEIPRGQPPRGGDIELGTDVSMNSGELGLENFFKKVLGLPCLLFLQLFIHLIILYEEFCFFSQVQEIEKQNEKLDKLLKKLQVYIAFQYFVFFSLYCFIKVMVL